MGISENVQDTYWDIIITVSILKDISFVCGARAYDTEGVDEAESELD